VSIFVCYRRSDSRHLTGRIHDWLELKLPNEKVIRDVEALQPGGVPYKEQLRAALCSCDVFILIIASNWLVPRLADDSDVLREEIEQALAMQIAIIPVLIDDAGMPDEASVPNSISGFRGYQSLNVRSERGFKQDVLYLIQRVESTLANVRERRLKAAIPEFIWAATRSSNRGMRIGAVVALAEMLPGDQTGAVRQQLREMTADVDATVSRYAEESLEESAAEEGLAEEGLAERLAESVAPTVAPNHDGHDLPGGLEDVLDEADFFASRGLVEDARNILVEQLRRTPKHTLVLEALSALDKRIASDLSARFGPPVDIAQWLSELDAREPNDGSLVPVAQQAALAVDVDAVFEKFRAGIRDRVPERDSATHYDLAVAYHEMGLYDDAREELDLAARDRSFARRALQMVGATYEAQGRFDSAEVAALSALQMKSEEPILWETYSILARVLENQGKVVEALNYLIEAQAQRTTPELDARIARLRVMLAGDASSS
jgi:tetratricopeptide (TPR) repeat protein